MGPSQDPVSSPSSSQIPRPPTPPRASNKNSADQDTHFLITIPPLPTPESSYGSTTPVVDGSRKKVEWSPFNAYQEHPGSTTKNTSLFHLPPSGLRKAPRSILKSRNVLMPQDLNDTSTPSPTPTYANFATMLESVVRQLAGEDQTSRIDAYRILSGTLRACENIPDPRALKDKMGLISQFMKRDILTKISGGGVDNVLVVNALLLLSSLLHKQSAAELFEHDFCVFVIEHAIFVFETGQASKDIISRLLGVVCCQKFSSKVMSAERVGRLMTAINNLENHVKGKTIEAGRLRVYSSLLKQDKSLMLANTVWIEEMLHDMMSSSKEIRALAIRFGIEAGLSLGTESQVSRALQSIFQAEVASDNNHFAAFYVEKLTKMLRDNEDPKQVPQIWIVIVLFLRHKRDQLEQWEHLKPWLSIIQECFNNLDLTVRIQAYKSWNLFVFATRPHPRDNPTLRISKLLDTPILGLMSRRISADIPTRIVAQYRKAVFGCICNLLYYFLRPDITSTQLDRYWDMYVVPLMAQSIKLKDGKRTIVGKEKTDKSGDGVSQACLILKGLFDQTPKRWVETRAIEAEPLTPAELPSLNPQWIRTNMQRVLAVVEPLIQISSSDLSSPDSPVSSLWNALCGALSAAGAMEIKVSNDTMIAIAKIYNVLYKLWNQHMSKSSKSFFRDFEYLVSTMITKLGVLPFTERPLSFSHSNEFTAITTTQQKASRGEVRSPLHHLVVLICQARSNRQDEDDAALKMNRRNTMLSTILTPFFNARESRKTRLDFVEEMTQLVSVEDHTKDLPSSWEVLVAFAEQALKTTGEIRNFGPNNEHQLALEYRCAVKIIEGGLSTGSDSVLGEARCLLHSLIAQVKLESGDAGVAIAVIEPLAKGLLEKYPQIPDNLLMSFCPILLQNSQYPKDRQALEASRRRLWGASGGPRSNSIDPYNYLYQLANCCLQSTYSQMSLPESRTILLEVLELMERCPPRHLSSTLERCQEGWSFWIRDTNHKLKDREIATMLCERMNNSIKKLPHHKSMTLNKLDVLISSGFESRHAFIANAAAETWNSTFGGQTSLEYPPRLLEALARVRLVSEIELPCFPDTLPNDIDSAAPVFFDTQDYDENKSLSPEAANEAQKSLATSRPLLSGRKAANTPVLETDPPNSRKRVFESTPEPKARKKSKSTPLRHDDSQIQFAHIESSPVSENVMESQLLTDRQKEVKERQKADAAAIFSNFGSSSIFRNTFDSPAPFASALGLPSRKFSAERPSTPIIDLSAPSIFDDDIRSSPTPASGNVISLNNEAPDPPSSPPEKIIATLRPSESCRKIVSQDYGEISLGDITVGPGGIIETKSVVSPVESKLSKKATSNRCAPTNLHGFRAPTPTKTHVEPLKELETNVFADPSTTSAKDPIKEVEEVITTRISPRASSESSSLSKKTPESARSTQRNSQGLARHFLDRALSFQDNIKSLISPKRPVPADTPSSPLDEESVLRVLRQFDPPEKNTPNRGFSLQPDQPDDDTPTRASASQPISRDDYDALSPGPSSGRGKKRKLAHATADSGAEEPPASEWDSQESWCPSTQDDDEPQSQAPCEFLSTIPETPAAPGVADAGQALSNRRLTRSLRRKILSESHLASSAVSPPRPTETPITETKMPREQWASAAPTSSRDPGARPRPGFEIALDSDANADGSSPSGGHREASSPLDARLAAKRRDTPEPAGTVLVQDSLLVPDCDADVDMDDDLDTTRDDDERRDRGSSPSQQLIHDSYENSQRLPFSRDSSPSPPEHPVAARHEDSGVPEAKAAVHATEADDHDAVVADVVAGLTVEQLLTAAMEKLDGVVVDRHEVWELEGLLMQVKGKLFEAERREWARQKPA